MWACYYCALLVGAEPVVRVGASATVTVTKETQAQTTGALYTASQFPKTQTEEKCRTDKY
jgi:hypothetical protein